MATPPTFADLFAAGRREALSRPTRLQPEVFDTDGTDVQIAVAATAAMAEEVGAYAQGELNAGRLRTAASVSEAALEQWGASEVGEVRRGALAAIVPLSWTRSPGAGTSIPAGTLVGTKGGVTFATITALTFQPNQVGPLVVAALASTGGPGGNVAAGTITEKLSTLEDLTIAVTNPEPAAGGVEVESIEDYQARLQTAYQRARRGTLTAIESGAAADPGVASARAYEVLDGDAQTGRVVLQILGHGGVTNAALAARVRSSMQDYRAAGVPVVVEPLNPRSIAIRAFGLIVLPLYDPEAVLDEAADALVAMIEDMQVGETLYRAQVLGTLASIEGLQVPDGSLVSPSTDVVPGPGEFLRTSRSLIYLSTEPLGG